MKFTVEQFREFNEPFEGSIKWLYLDVRGLVTTGVGNLIEPIEEALKFPWVHRDTGLAALPTEVEDEWRAVKANIALATEGAWAAEKVTLLRITDDTINALMKSRLDLNEVVFRQRFPAYDSWPMEAQLALHSMAWAVGAHGVLQFHYMVGALLAGNFKMAATECRISDMGMKPLIARNAANEQLFTRAASAGSSGSDPDQISP